MDQNACSLDVIICTYNRAEQCLFLIDELQHLSFHPKNIIVVDASEQIDPRLQYKQGVRFLRSNHKNQPYQRYLGYLASSADILLYLDDDMEVAQEPALKIIQQHFQTTPSLSGLAICFKDKNHEGSLSAIPKSQFKQQGMLKQVWNWFSAYPQLASGTFGYCGNRGKQPEQGGPTSWLSGGAFAAKREGMYEQFNFQLFDLFEEKIGMGEDGILGYTLSKQGALHYEPMQLFWHHEKQQSHYATQHEKYAFRVLFSRLYLSLEKARLDNASRLYARMHYIWYALCRLIGYVLNWVKSPSSQRKQIVRGSWHGFKASWRFRFFANNERRAYWEEEAQKMISQIA